MKSKTSILVLLTVTALAVACSAGPDDSGVTAEPETTEGYRFPQRTGNHAGWLPAAPQQENPSRRHP